MKHKKTNSLVKYFNQFPTGANKLICAWLTEYIHTSYRYSKMNMDGSYLQIQPGWPEETVTSYRTYTDTGWSLHKNTRIMLLFESYSEYDISAKKFKQFLKQHPYLFDKEYKKAYVNT